MAQPHTHEEAVTWMVAEMLSPDEIPRRVAFVNYCEEMSKRVGHEAMVAALDEADAYCKEHHPQLMEVN